MNRAFLVLLPVALALSACGPAPSDEEEAAAQPAAPAAASSASPASGPQVEVAPTTMIHAEPAALPDCNPTVVTLRWDVRTAKPDLGAIRIYTGSGKLFAEMGSSGSVQTGGWVRPGSVFVLRSASDDAELERLTIGGPAACPGE